VGIQHKYSTKTEEKKVDLIKNNTLNFGIELIYQIINVLEDNLNKNRRQSFDYLPLSTPF
jgi:hypothetical protein